MTTAKTTKPAKLPHALYLAEQVRELDRCCIEEHGIPGIELMQHAGGATFSALQRCWPDARTITIVCGVGNNGGDGFVIARLAHQAGLKVSVYQCGNPAKTRGDALIARNHLLSTGVEIEPFSATLTLTADVIVDALLGTGLERKVEGLWAQAIAAINQSSAHVVAVDIPSGLHSDSGNILGICVKAALTVSFIGLKRGMFTGAGPEYCGLIEFDSLQIPTSVYSQQSVHTLRTDYELLKRRLPARSRIAHKGHCGHVLVVGGNHGFSGAVRLSAEACARVGAGLISVATRQQHASCISTCRPEIMSHGVETVDKLMALLAKVNVVAIGPGLGTTDWSQSLFTAVLASGLPLVIDADGLNLLAKQYNGSAPAHSDNWVLTPHPGEAARLLQTSVNAIQEDRFAAIANLHCRFGGSVVLKGAGTLIRSNQEQTIICNAGNPGMASGGMGDVLTGVIAGLIAQGLNGAMATQLGVLVHGMAADKAATAGERGLLASDLMPHLRTLVNPKHSS